VWLCHWRLRVRYLRRMLIGHRFNLVLLAAWAPKAANSEAIQRERWSGFRADIAWPEIPQLAPPRLPSLPPALRRFRPAVKANRRGSDLGDAAACEDLVGDLTSDDEGWQLQVERDGIRVWRRKVEGSSYDEIRGNGLVSAPPATVLALLRRGEAEIIREYNPMYDQGHDLEQLDPDTKVSYGSVRAIFPFKPRDTVTRVAFRPLPTLGGTALLLKAVEHPAMPVRQGYVRAKILRGMHLVQPVQGNVAVANFTFTQQINVGGIIPAWLINQLIAQDAVTFVKRLSAASAARK
jgi:hypothetical protein